MRVIYTFEVDLKDDSDPEAVGNTIFEFLADVPEELMPEIDVVFGFDYQVQR